MDYEYYFKEINKETKGKYDVSTLFSNPVVFQNLITDLSKPFKKVPFDCVASLESLGFIMGSALAYKHKKSFVPIRKGGKLPSLKKNIISSSFTDYSAKKKTLEINKGIIKKGQRVLLVDDWIESGQQMKAACALVEKQGGIVVGISTLTLHLNKETDLLCEKYKVHAIHVTR